MTVEEERAVTVTLDALNRLLNIFQPERWIYLLGGAAGLGLLLWAVYLAIMRQGGDATQLGLLFGASGLLAVTGGRITFLLNRSFDLVDVIIRKLVIGEVK